MHKPIQKAADALYRQRWALAAAILGAATFLLVYGTKVLDPADITWLRSAAQDPRQHYLGWAFYRDSPWRLPFLGMSYNVVYPHRISVLYSDSLPLCAVLCKLLSPLLPRPFQYLGLWSFLCYALLVLYPVLLARSLYHTALGSNWLILAALYLWLRAVDPALTILRSCAWWSVLGALCVSIHIYYLPMVGIILVGFLVRRAFARPPLKDLLLPVPLFCGAALAALFVLGSFNSNFSTPMTTQLWGADLLNLFVPGYVTTPSDNDIDIYIGAGLVLTVALGTLCLLAAWLVKPRWLARVPAAAGQWLVSGLVILALAAFASVSPTVIFAGRQLFTMPLPAFAVRLWGVFRSCGRIAWVIGYLLTAAACGLLLRLNGPVPGVVLLAACLAVQTAGQLPALRTESARYHTLTSGSGVPALTDPGWQTVAGSGSIRHVVFSSSRIDAPAFWQLCFLASEQGWTINSFYFSHVDPSLMWATAAGQLAELQNDTLYVFLDGEELRRTDYPLHYYRLDGILVGTVDALELPGADLPDPPAQAWIPADVLGPAGDTVLTKSDDGAVKIETGSVSGPDYDLWPGTYEVTLESSGFDHSYVYSGWNATNEPFNKLDIVWLEDSQKSAGKRLVFQFTLYETARNWHVNIHALDDTPVTVSGLSIKRTA